MILNLVRLKGLSDLDEAYFDSPAFNAIRIHAGGGEVMRGQRRLCGGLRLMLALSRGHVRFWGSELIAEEVGGGEAVCEDLGGGG